MKMVFSSPNITELTYVQSLLYENKIKYFMSDEQISNILPHCSVAMGGIKIYVNDDDFNNAREIIDKKFSKKIKKEEKHIYTRSNGKKCPKCNSKNIELTKKPRPFISFILSIIFFFPFPVKRKYYQCRDCKSYWNDKEISSPGILNILLILIIFIIIWGILVK